MWPLTRYTLVCWGWPPHDAALILESLIDVFERIINQPGIWQVEGATVEPVPTSTQAWRELIEYNRDRDNGSLSLFINSSAGYSLELTVDYPPYVRSFDVLTLHLPEEHLLARDPTVNFEALYSLFKEVIGLFRPFWAWIHDGQLLLSEEIRSLRFTLDRTKVPDTIHWFNYFSSDIVARLGGTQTLLAAPVYLVDELSQPAGMILILRPEPFDYYNAEHMRHQLEVVKYLQLNSLHVMYPLSR
jgi:hypothetical protein